MNQDWDRIGKEIRTIVEDAVNSQDYSQLNKAIANTINDAVGSIQKGMRTAGKSVNDAVREQKKELFSAFQDPGSQTISQKQEKFLKNENKIVPVDGKRKDLFLKNTSVKAGGLALTICGCLFNTGLGLAVVILILISIFLGEVPLGIKIALSILVPFLAGSAVMTWKGTSMLSAVKRYRKYIEGLQGKTYCNIKELAARSGKSISYVVKDVRRMIEKGWFRQGHLNQDQTCLIVTHETYQEYQEIQEQRQQLQVQEQKSIQEQPLNRQMTENYEKLQQVIDKGEQYIQKIRLCSGKIPGAEISRKISHMEMLIQKIFERVKEDPDSLDDISRMMEYYLPTTVKLLEAYLQLCSQPVQGENIRSSRMEIEQTLDTLNDAFEKLLDSLFEDVAWDVSSDISVLHTMLAQEGLVGTDDWKMQR